MGSLLFRHFGLALQFTVWAKEKFAARSSTQQAFAE